MKQNNLILNTQPVAAQLIAPSTLPISIVAAQLIAPADPHTPHARRNQLRSYDRYWRHIRRNQLRGYGLFFLCLIFLISLCPFSPVSAHTLATGQGHIFGQLLDGTNNNTPIAEQEVTLQMAQGNNSSDLTTAKTDAQGAYSFTGLSTDKTMKYAIYIRYQGAHYVSSIVTLDSKAEQQVNLTVYEASSDTSKVAVLQTTMLIGKPDAKKGSFTVSEFLAFKNLDTHTFVGSLDATQGRPKALFFSLPSGTRNINLSSGFDGYRSLQAGSGFASEAALPPGNTEFAFTFEVPYTGSSYDFRYQAMYPTVNLSFMLPSDMHATTDTLQSSGVITANQRPYQLFKTDGLLAQHEIHVKLEGLPAPALTSAATPIDSQKLWLIAGLLLLLAIISVTSFIYRFSKQKDNKKLTGEKYTPKRSTAAKMTKYTKEHDAQQKLLHELLELDKAYEAGKLSKAVYEERRAKTKARLRSLMSEKSQHGEKLQKREGSHR